ncbi:MAG: hypothetical protein M1829_000420 [Trizodia sp. TS-e1964]|nr:MAG: hypothetical protein M1829_000420 [Trizodia sp. TS-e1964]
MAGEAANLVQRVQWAIADPLREHASHSKKMDAGCVVGQQGQFGASCRYSHDVGSRKGEDRGPAPRRQRADETPDEQLARASYSSWRSLIRRTAQPDNLLTMHAIWEGALEILNGDDRDWKQTLPKDLDNDDELNGRHHILVLLSYRSQTSNNESYIKITQTFLTTITHPAMVSCLSVDTYVGSLYSFISGANGTRAIPFFQNLCDALIDAREETYPTIPFEIIDSSLIALSTALSELLRREPRARFNESLPDLIDSIETASELLVDNDSAIALNIVTNRISDLRAVIARACGLLTDGAHDGLESHNKSLLLQSTYPRNLVVPSNRHDNDKADITEISIYPTLDEILSDAKEFLPSTDPDQPHFLTSKLERHIDTQFRLLRHDIFGKLKDALAGLLTDIVDDSNQLKISRLEFGETRTYVYSNSFVSYFALNNRGELQAQISFPQPHSIRKGLGGDRSKWWEESKRMEVGVLLSFISIKDDELSHMFFTVAERSTDTKNEGSLTHNSSTATITIKLAFQDQPSVEALLGLSISKTRGTLIEFPNVVPATFVPVLENLQNMQRLSRLPFREWIQPDRVEGPPGLKLQIPPPLYARHAGFTFPMASLLKPGAAAMSLSPSILCKDSSFIAELETNTELDHGQCEALLAALIREYAFIQGPPGTGKSYLGVKLIKILLDIKERADLGPIIIVCYTNHALDQFLEHLVISGITKIVRVGGQSRSQLLENHNLRDIAKSEGKSKHEGYQVATAYKALDELHNKSKRIIGRLHGIQRRPEWRYFDYYLRQYYKRIHNQLDDHDSDGFAVVGRHPFETWMQAGAKIDLTPAQNMTGTTKLSFARTVDKANIDIHSLTHAERRMLIDQWSESLQERMAEEFYELLKDADSYQRNLSNVHAEVDRRVLQDADIIGLTTSGLAKHISTLSHVQAKVVLCEEAGEVMEPHILSALLPAVEHFIQIGDHQQLRPQINNFQDLSLESDRGVLYQLDRSQFERLSVGQRGRPSMPVAQLNVQRRMRPEISTLIRETMYEKLTDHPSTSEFPDVVGMRKNLFWLDHDNMEDQGQAEIQHKKSKSNEWEVELVLALVRHMVRQGVYTSSDIAVLTPYTGQLQKLRVAMRNDFEIVLSDRDQEALTKDGFGIHDLAGTPAVMEQNNKRKPLEKKTMSDLLRLSTVDNFQGEESKVIIISLTRSNGLRKVGFLKTTNRINVLLSRAQHGMYIIGNADTYSNVPMWQKVINMLRATDSIGPSLELCSLKVAAERPATTASQIADTNVRPDAIRKLCMRLSNASNPANADILLATTLVKRKPVMKIAGDAWLRSMIFSFRAAISKTMCPAGGRKT